MSKGHSIHMLVGKDLHDFDHNELEVRLRAEGVDTGMIKSKFK